VAGRSALVAGSFRGDGLGWRGIHFVLLESGHADREMMIKLRGVLGGYGVGYVNLAFRV
jgi:hypothetical protein